MQQDIEISRCRDVFYFDFCIYVSFSDITCTISLYFGMWLATHEIYWRFSDLLVCNTKSIWESGSHSDTCNRFLRIVRQCVNVRMFECSNIDHTIKVRYSRIRESTV